MKLKVFLLCFFLSVFSVTAQVSVSPEHDFYSMANGWLLKGYVKQLPQIKPYPINVIKKILNEVAVCGNTTEEDKAKILYEEIFNKKWNLSIALGFSENISKIFRFTGTFCPFHVVVHIERRIEPQKTHG